jgi:hypothetical protein
MIIFITNLQSKSPTYSFNNYFWLNLQNYNIVHKDLQVEEPTFVALN